MEDRTMKKKQYQTPDTVVIRLNTTVTLLSTSTSITGFAGSPGEDLFYGGYDNDGEGD